MEKKEAMCLIDKNIKLELYNGYEIEGKVTKITDDRIFIRYPEESIEGMRFVLGLKFCKLQRSK